MLICMYCIYLYKYCFLVGVEDSRFDMYVFFFYFGCIYNNVYC